MLQKEVRVPIWVNRYVLSVMKNQEIISDIYEQFQSKEWKFNCRFVYLMLINTAKWKLDYIIFKQRFVNFYLDCKVINFKYNISITSCVPLRKTKNTAGYDLYAAENKIIEPCTKT